MKCKGIFKNAGRPIKNENDAKLLNNEIMNILIMNYEDTISKIVLNSKE